MTTENTTNDAVTQLKATIEQVTVELNPRGTLGHDLIHEKLTTDFEDCPIIGDTMYVRLTCHDYNDTEYHDKWIKNTHMHLVNTWSVMLYDPENQFVILYHDEIYRREDCVSSDEEDQLIPQELAVWSERLETYITAEWAVYSEFACSHLPRNDCSYHDGIDEWYPDDQEDEFMEHNDLNETPKGAGVLNDYHCSPTPTKVNERIESKGWWLGFEVEKNSMSDDYDDDIYKDVGDDVVESDFFSGWETDSSCGVEGISNIYNLTDTETFISHVDSAPYLNEPVNKNCGGHISVSYVPENYNYSTNLIVTDNADIKQVDTALLSSYVGLIYAMFPRRLERSYCNSNKKLKRNAGVKYQPIRDAGGGVEIRLFSAVKSAQTLKNRFKFLQAFLPAVEKAEKLSVADRTLMMCNTPRLPRSISNTTLELVEQWESNLISKINFGYNPYYRYSKYILNECWDVINELYDSSDNKDERLARIICDTYAFTNYLKTDAYPHDSIKKYLNYE